MATQHIVSSAYQVFSNLFYGPYDALDTVLESHSDPVNRAVRVINWRRMIKRSSRVVAKVNLNSENEQMFGRVEVWRKHSG